MYIPREILDIILEYDGRIKCRKGIYSNIISKNDERYRSLDIFIRKKIEILQKIIVYDKIQNRYLFYVDFEQIPNMGLVYDCNYTFPNEVHINFYHFNVF